MQSAKLTVYLGSLFLIVLLLVCLLAASVPESTIKVSKASRMQLSRIVPEGWAFFTRDPKGPEIILYQQTSGGTWKRFVQRPSTPRYLFGISRKARAINQEFGRMLEDLPADSTWQEISGPIEQQSLWADSLPVTKIPNASLYPMLEGVYVLQKIEPVPWAWARSSNIQAYVKSKICKIHVVKSKRLAE